MGAVCSCVNAVNFDGEINLSHFRLLRIIGRGALGIVRVVQHKRTRNVYALHYIDKARCIQMKPVHDLIQERRVLEEIDHPFVANLRYAFQDHETCFLGLDLMLGGTLQLHLARVGSLSENSVRFYIAEISGAIAFLHKKKIVHRDIKPDNILLDADGHAHLTHFNVATYHPEDRFLTGVVGSQGYLAPEILVEPKEYSYAIDWWSLGVTAYELAFGRRPLRKPSEMMHDIQEHVQSPNEDENGISSSGIVVLRAFLERDPFQRLGCETKGGFDGIKQQAWFKAVDWQKLVKKELAPPLLPKANAPYSFLSYEFGPEERPITVEHQTNNQELKLIENQFTVFDSLRMERQTYYPDGQQHIRQ